MLITDKDLIVFLIAKGFKIEKIEKDSHRDRSLIYFCKTKELDEAILAFANKTEVINICEYQAAERRIKTILCLQKGKS